MSSSSCPLLALLGPDLWRTICLHLSHAPHAAVRVLMTSRALRAALTPRDPVNAPWWRAFLRAVECAHHHHHGPPTSLPPMLLRREGSGARRRRLLLLLMTAFACHDYYFYSHHHHHHGHGHGHSSSGSSSSSDNTNNGGERAALVLRAVFSPRCGRCGARFGHRLLTPFWKMRVCARCLPRCTVSNHALEQEYGVALFEVLLLGACAGGVLPLDCFDDRLAALERLSDAPESELRFFARERRSGQYIRGGALVFLWRDDVERALGDAVSLEGLRPAQAVRRRAAAMLTARVRRLGERLLLLRPGVTTTTAKAPRPLLLAPSPLWMPGGHLSSASGRPRALLSPALSHEALRWLQARLQAARAPTVKARHWFPPLPPPAARRLFKRGEAASA
jgi:hypothetical protein